MKSQLSADVVKKTVREALRQMGVGIETASVSTKPEVQKSDGMTTTVAIGCDHGGFELKEDLKTYLQEMGKEVIDCGTKGKEAVDYPMIAEKVAAMVSSGQAYRGIMIDGAGIGSCVVANKVPGVRAALCYDLSTARNSREHNDANLLTLGGRLVGAGLAREIVATWLGTDCTEERHLRRVSQIMDVEKKYCSATASNGSQAANTSTASSPSSASSAATVSRATVEPAEELGLDEVVDRIVQKMSSRLTPEGLAKTIESACDPCHGCGLCVEKQADQVRRIIELGAGRVSAAPGIHDIPAQLARFIDHTLLKPEATQEQIEQLCEEAQQYGFATVCVNPSWVKLCRDRLQNSDVKVCAVVGFPLGANTPELKGFEARQAIRDGAREIDMVINVGALKSGQDERVQRDIAAVTEACRDGSATSKVIIEAALLTDEEKIRACQLARAAKADFVKTSTGFGPGGATDHDVALMKEAVQCQLEVKAAGGIRTLADTKKMLQAGATRIGASAGVKILQEAEQLVASS
jgi:deoxyribose-phosphate aldolase